MKQIKESYKVVKLTCGHETDTPAPNAVVNQCQELCPICNIKKTIMGVWEYGSLRCRTCHKVSKLYGYNIKTRVEKIVQKHSNRYPSHIVACYVNGKLLFTATQAYAQPELELVYEDEKPPPF